LAGRESTWALAGLELVSEFSMAQTLPEARLDLVPSRSFRAQAQWLRSPGPTLTKTVDLPAGEQQAR